jgi:YD repeat-containing protein
VPSGTGSIGRTQGQFDPGLRPTLVVDERGVQTTTTYDLYGRPVMIHKDGEADTQITYPDFWTKVAKQDQKTTTMICDGFGRLIRQVQPDGRTVVPSYDLHSRIVATRETSPTGRPRTRYTGYDVLDRVTARTAFDGLSATLAYSTDGVLNTITRTIQNINPALVTATTTDPFGQVVAAQAPNGDLTQTLYDGWGNERSVTVTPAAGGTAQVRSFSSDLLGRLTSKSEPETGVQTFAQFNALNLAALWTEGAMSSSPRVHTRVYDGLGRLRSQMNGLTQETFTYGGAFLAGSSRTMGSNQVTQAFTFGAPGARLSQETTTGSVAGAW